MLWRRVLVGWLKTTEAGQKTHQRQMRGRHWEAPSDQFACLASDEETAKRINDIVLEFDYHRQWMSHPPEALTVGDMKMLLTVESAEDRQALFQLIRNKENYLRRLKRRQKTNTASHLSSSHLCMSIDDYQAKNLTKHRQSTAAQLGQRLVIDLRLEEEQPTHRSALLHQLADTFWLNYKQLQEPFDLHFCCTSDSLLVKTLANLVSEASGCRLNNIHHQPARDVFKNLVAVVPFADNLLECVDPDAVFLVPATVRRDLLRKSLAIYKHHRIPVVSLPFSRFCFPLRPDPEKWLTLKTIVGVIGDRSSLGWRAAFERHLNNELHRPYTTDEEEFVKVMDKKRRQAMAEKVERGLKMSES